MEPRLLIAYALIALVGGGGIVWATVAQRRRAARKLRLRGIQTHERAAR